MEIKRDITIVHLYPDEMNLYGDSGNVICLSSRLKRRGFNTKVKSIGMGDSFKDDFDILFIGGGQDREMNIIKSDLRKKSQALKYFIESGKVILAVCGGYQILGEYYKSINNEEIKLSGALPFYTEAIGDRMIGNYIFSTPFGKIAGFENHSGRTYLSKGLNPLGKIIKGYGNNGFDKTEGVMYKNTFGTYAHGPVLPKNINFADELIHRATGAKLEKLDDSQEELCHNYLIKRFGV